jgi:hypothetical protein
LRDEVEEQKEDQEQDQEQDQDQDRFPHALRKRELADEARNWILLLLLLLLMILFPVSRDGALKSLS